jgi:hypothetical protein
VSYQDYFPFGSNMPDRGSNAYIYGFNGQEKDNGIYGDGNSYTAEYWQYDTRLGRRWNRDPLEHQFSSDSPYSCFFNNPIFYRDPLGLTGEPPAPKKDKVQEGEGPAAVAKRNGITLEQLAKWNPEIFKNYEDCPDKTKYWQNEEKNYMLHPDQELIVSDPTEYNNFMNQTWGEFSQNPNDVAEWAGGGWTEEKQPNFEEEMQGCVALIEGIGTAILLNQLSQFITSPAVAKTVVKQVYRSANKGSGNKYTKFPNASRKYGKHKDDFPGLSETEYYNRAISLANSKIGGNILGFTSKGGWTFRMNIETGEFLTINPAGEITTFYRRLIDPAKYWAEQIEKYGKQN